MQCVLEPAIIQFPSSCLVLLCKCYSAWHGVCVLDRRLTGWLALLAVRFTLDHKKLCTYGMLTCRQQGVRRRRSGVFHRSIDTSHPGSKGDTQPEGQAQAIHLLPCRMGYSVDGVQRIYGPCCGTMVHFYA